MQGYADTLSCLFFFFTFFLPFSQHLETWNGTFDYIFTESPSVPVWSVLRLWQKPVWRETEKQPSRLIDSKAKRMKRDKCSECGEVLRCRGWGWPEVRLFWFPLPLWAGLELLKSSAHHLLILLWVWWTGTVYHWNNLWDYTKDLYMVSVYFMWCYNADKTKPVSYIEHFYLKKVKIYIQYIIKKNLK